MKTIETTLQTTALYSDDETKRYLLRKEWDSSKPKLCVIMLAPSTASGIGLDSTTLLVLNNASRLDYGRVDILNLFSTLNDFDLEEAEHDDPENNKAILASAKECDAVVYAAGVGKAKNELFQERQKQVLHALRPFESKLYCIGNQDGTIRLRHPLSPAVRTWTLSKLKVTEVIPDIVENKPTAKAQKKKKDSV